ncbi:DUF1330 domain-containing protein [Pontibacter chitinilyticus]|uniref:DUF1330 domain-containing protein n=1 Tax=Pontibacter chitinilyticus TaxID=2674989 RepID=UPI00321A1285
MPAYILVDIHVTDPATYEDYKKLTPPSLVAYQGRFIVRGGQTEPLEGDWQPSRLVVLEFPTVELAKAWWNSPEYAPAKAMRQQAATTNMLLVEGYPG